VHHLHVQWRTPKDLCQLYLHVQWLQVYIHQESPAAHESRLSLVGQWLWSGQRQKVMVDLILLAMLWSMVLQMHTELCSESLSKVQLHVAHWLTSCAQEELISLLLLPQTKTKLGVESFQISLSALLLLQNQVTVFNIYCLYTSWEILHSNFQGVFSSCWKRIVLLPRSGIKGWQYPLCQQKMHSIL